MMRRFLIVMILCATTSVARATVYMPADLGELSRDAWAIARGRVVAVDAQWTEGRRTIETIVTLEPEAYLKGQSGSTVQFRVPGAPRFAVGQRVIVFLGARGPTVPYVLGLSQGVFRLTPSTAGEWMVSPSAILPTMQGPIVRGSLTLGPLPLAEFEREVRALAGGSR